VKLSLIRTEPHGTEQTQPLISQGFRNPAHLCQLEESKEAKTGKLKDRKVLRTDTEEKEI
jgi:hypothetical protein